MQGWYTAPSVFSQTGWRQEHKSANSIIFPRKCRKYWTQVGEELIEKGLFRKCFAFSLTLNLFFKSKDSFEVCHLLVLLISKMSMFAQFDEE